MIIDKILKRNCIHYYFGRNNKPAVAMASGETILVEAERADSMYLNEDRPVFNNRNEVMVNGPNPVTGPIFIEGAIPGDRLLVTILDIKPCPDGSLGYVTYVDGQGALMNPYTLNAGHDPSTVWCRMEDKRIILKLGVKDVVLPVEPFIGTIGVAPPEERRASYWNGQEFAGNIDCPSLKVKSTIVLPVHVEGALLSLGDIHARQGHGEIAGCAIECRGDALIRVEVVKGENSEYYEWPQVNTAEYIGSVGCIMNSLDKAVQAATYDLLRRLELYYGFSTMDAYLLLGQCVEFEICQMTNPFCCCLAKINRRYIS